MDRERLEILDWLVRFIQTDLHNLRPGDKAKLRVELIEYLFPPREDLEELGRYLTGPPILIPFNLPKIEPEKIRKAIQELTPPRTDSPEFWEKILALQATVQKDIALFFMLGAEDLDRQKKFSLRWHGEAFNELKIEKGKFVLSSLPLRNHEEYLFFRLATLFFGLPPTTLRKCRDCEKLFVNPRKEEKQFCSPRCMWRFYAEKQRRADPAAYRKKQREYMKNVYRAKKGLLPKKKKNPKEG